MNPESPSESFNESQQPVADSMGDRCLAYLVGELSGKDTIDFERQLASSSSLRDELNHQSELLVALAELKTLSTVAPAVAQPSDHSHSVDRTQPRWLEILVALAACLLIAFVGWNANRQTNETKTANVPDEANMIAAAWAVGGSITDVSAEIDKLDLELDLEFDVPSEETDNASLTWVSAAIESGVAIDG